MIVASQYFAMTQIMHALTVFAALRGIPPACTPPLAHVCLWPFEKVSFPVEALYLPGLQGPPPLYLEQSQ